MTQFQKQSPKAVLQKDILKIWTKFTGELPCGSVISKMLQRNLITLPYGCCHVKLLHICGTHLLKNTFAQELLQTQKQITSADSEAVP